MSTLGLDGVSADLAGQNAPRHRTFEPVGRVEDKIAQVHRPCADMHHKGAAERHHDRHHGFAP
eukprot:scaffold25480_cov35-Phaeocystis_antarctica.AAC.2